MSTYVFCFTCFAHFHFSFQVPTFPKMPFRDPQKAAASFVLHFFMCRRIKWKCRSSKRQEEELLTWLSNLNLSIFCLSGRLCPLQLISPYMHCDCWSKMAASERSWLILKDGKQMQRRPLHFIKTTGKGLPVLKLQYITCLHQYASCCPHLRINSSYPEANPVMEILDDTAAFLKWWISTSISCLDKNMNKRWRPLF